MLTPERAEVLSLRGSLKRASDAAAFWFLAFELERAKRKTAEARGACGEAEAEGRSADEDARIAELERQVALSKEDEKALSGVLEAVKAELDRALTPRGCDGVADARAVLRRVRALIPTEDV